MYFSSFLSSQDNYVVVERRPMKFADISECTWVYSCSCDQNKAKWIKSLSKELDTPFTGTKYEFMLCLCDIFPGIP